jgi:hypothetical protein
LCIEGSNAPAEQKKNGIIFIPFVAVVFPSVNACDIRGRLECKMITIYPSYREGGDGNPISLFISDDTGE